MTRSLLPNLLGGLLIAVSLSSICRSEPSRSAEDGFVPLFNGKDLTGWRVGKEVLDGKTASPDQRFQVVDGVIVCNEGKGIKDLYTVKEFDKDFQLKLEFRASPRSDSGVYIRGLQLQVRDYPTVGPYKPKSFRAGDWNDLEITVRKAATIVNGEPLADTDVLELTIKDGKTAAKRNGKALEIQSMQVMMGPTALCKCNGEILDPAFKVPAKGGIGLQAETGKFEFRNVRIKELP
jgi:hypothetical protein